MIIELKKDNLEIIENSFLEKEEVVKELDNNPYARFLVLVENDKVIGYLYYSDIYERAEINQCEIQKEYRNQGKGNLLLQEFLKRTDKDITLEVKEDNTPAIHIYEKNGFQKKAIRKGHYQGTDGLLMEKKKEKDSLK